MRILRDRSTPIAALLLATLALAGVAEDSHRHDSLATPTGHLDLPTVSAEHAQPDHTVRIEGASLAESESCLGCIGCLPQQRQLAIGTSAPVLVGLGPDTSALATESVGGLGIDTRRLEPSRAPPRA